MKDFILSLLLSGIALWLLGVLSLGICYVLHIGAEHPQYSMPALVFVWMCLAWFIHWAPKNM